MSFQVYRKYQAPLMIAALVFTVLVFVAFPSVGDIGGLFDDEDGPGGLMGEFTVATTGESERVSRDDFFEHSRKLSRFSRGVELTDDDIWASMMLRADARGAGLEVSDADMFQALFSGAQVTKSNYEAFWRSMNFASAREFESMFREVVLETRWREFLLQDAMVIDADGIFETYSGANERFDFDVAMIANVSPDELEDPGDEVLLESYESLAPATRDRLYATPARKDIVHAWRELDASLEAVDAELLGALPEVSAAQVEARYSRVKALRWPDEPAEESDGAEDAEEAEDAEPAPEGPTDEQRALLELELKNIELLAAAAAELNALEGELDKPTFLATAERYSLQTADPEGLLDPESLEALDVIGGARLSSRLRLLTAGELHHLRPFLPEEEVSFMVLVEDSADPEPLAFEDAREQVFERWKTTQGNRDAMAFLDALTEAAKQREEAVELIAAVSEASATRVQERLESDTATDAMVVHAEEAERLESDIEAALRPLHHLVFDEVAQAMSAELLSFDGVSRAYRRLEAAKPEEEREDATSVAYFAKSGGWVFGLGIDEVSAMPTLHAASDTWCVARVRDIVEPTKADMLADREGMLQSRDMAQQIAAQMFQLDLTETAIVQAHELFLTEVAEPETDVEESLDG